MRPLVPACRLELTTLGRPESVRLLDLDGDGRDELYAVTRAAPRAGGGDGGTLHVWRDLFSAPRVIELPDYLLGPEPVDGGLVLASRSSSELIHIDPGSWEVTRAPLPGIPRALSAGPAGADGAGVVAVALVDGSIGVRFGDDWTWAHDLKLVTRLFLEPGALWAGCQQSRSLTRFPIGSAAEFMGEPGALTIDLGGIPRDIGRFDGDGAAELWVAGGDDSLWTVAGERATAQRVGSIPIALAGSDQGLVVLGHGELSYRVQRKGQLVHRAYAGQDAWDLATGDFDGDGSTDLVIANRGALRVSVVLGARGGGFHEAQEIPAGRGPARVATLDLDGDGRRELLTVDTLGDALLVLSSDAASDGANDGDGRTLQSTPITGVVKGFWAGALDDPDLERLLVVIEDSGGGGRLEVWGPQRAPSGSPRLKRLHQADLPGVPGEFAVLDPGTAEVRVAVADPRGGLWLVPWSAQGPGDPQHIQVDGSPVCLVGLGDQLAVGLGGAGKRHGIAFLSSEDGVEQQFVNLGGTSPIDLAAYDQDGDGQLELAALVTSKLDGPGRLALLRRTDKTWRGFGQYPTGLRPYAVAAGDLDGDGRDELVVGAQNSHHINLWSPSGETLRALPDLGVGRGVLDVQVMAVDGDGRRAVLCANGFSGSLGLVRLRAGK
jgi:FG-GAP-like repeat